MNNEKYHCEGCRIGERCECGKRYCYGECELKVIKNEMNKEQTKCCQKCHCNEQCALRGAENCCHNGACDCHQVTEHNSYEHCKDCYGIEICKRVLIQLEKEVEELQKNKPLRYSFVLNEVLEIIRKYKEVKVE